MDAVAEESGKKEKSTGQHISDPASWKKWTRMSKLTRDGMALPVSRDEILRGERGQGKYFTLLN